MKKALLYLFIFTACISIYFLLEIKQQQKLIAREINYVSDSASEIYIVWGINYLQEPPAKYWPGNSYLKDHLVYTKMVKSGTAFHSSIGLPSGTSLNYWIVQTRDSKGHPISLWDSGTDSFYKLVYRNGLINFPGLFVYLAGLIPLVIFFLRNRNNEIAGNRAPAMKIGTYIPALDSLRAIAVILVIIHHWVPENSLLNFLPNGPLGVNIFFVLSGFLITGILLREKETCEEMSAKKIQVFRNFYVRRSLRIFPIYYLYLVILWCIKDPSLVKNGGYFFSYTSNYLFYQEQYFPGRVAHLWSLGVEEQFYLIWPFLIIFSRNKYLPYFMAFFFITGIASNYLFQAPGWWPEILTTSCFDAFAVGSMLSWAILYKPDFLTRIRPYFSLLLFVVLLLFLLNLFSVSFIPKRTIHAFLAILLIYYCLFKKDNTIMNGVLNNKWLMGIGKISYGIYLYHLIVPELWNAIVDQCRLAGFDLFFNNALPTEWRPAWLFVQDFLFLLGISLLSWKLIEKPLNSLKAKFVLRPIRS